MVKISKKEIEEFIPNVSGNDITLDRRDYSIKKYWDLGKASGELIPEEFFVDSAKSTGVNYQRKTPACGAHSVTHYKESIDAADGKVRTYSPRFLWALTRLADGFSPDTGSNIRTVMGQLKSFGIVTERTVPNDTNMSNEEYVKLDITDKLLNQASENKILVYTIDYHLSMDDIKRTIYNGNGAILSMRLGSEWYTNKDGVSSWNKADIYPLRPLENEQGGHYVFACGYDKDYIYFKNSWSDRWADGGYNKFGKDVLPQVKMTATMLNVDKKTHDLMKLKSLLEQLVTLYRQLLAMKT